MSGNSVELTELSDVNLNDANANRRLTVFHVRNSNYLGGIETTLIGWFKYADAMNCTPRLQVFKERRGLHERSVKFLAEQGIECEMLPWGHARNLPGAVFQLWRRVRKATNPILHSHDTRSDLVAMIVSRLVRCPLVISNHAWHPAELKRKVLESIRAKLMHAANLVISVSRNTHIETLERGVPASKCMYLYSGIDLEPYASAPTRAQARKTLDLQDDAFVVGNIARLWPEKEQATLVDAAALLATRYPTVRFLIVGSGPLENELRIKIRKAGLDHVVLMPGYCEDFVSVLAALDIFAFPSSAEGTPMVIYSAMAMGVPIVASPVSGVGEILADNESGMFVPAADPEALAAAIESLIQDPLHARQLGDTARLNCNTHYSAAVAIERLEEIYRKLMQMKRPDTKFSEQVFQKIQVNHVPSVTRGNIAVQGAGRAERRATPRVAARIPVEVDCAAGEQLTAYTIDLSEGGMRIEYASQGPSRPISEGELVKITINSPYLTARSVRVVEEFRVLECKYAEGVSARARLQSTAVQNGIASSLAAVHPHDFVVPPELDATFLKTQAQVNLCLPEADSKILIFTAAESGAGNSTVSWWFAVCLARTPERRVLYIDATGDSPRSDSDTEPAAGFLGLLLGQRTMESTIVSLGAGAPHYLGAGNAGCFTSGDIRKSHVDLTFDNFREQFDYVIIDAPPAAQSPQTILWAQSADGCMLVLDAGNSQRDAAEAAVSRLRRAGASVLGAVLNRR